jgi:hypothetical protein
MRSPDGGYCAATNHFRSPELATDLECWRFQRLTEWRDQKPLSVADVARALHAVNQGPNTIHSVVFEPGPLVAHVAIGKGPSTAAKRVVVDLRPLLRPGENPTGR